MAEGRVTEDRYGIGIGIIPG